MTKLSIPSRNLQRTKLNQRSYSYCPFQKVGRSQKAFSQSEKADFCNFFQKFQSVSTFFLGVVRKRQRYEKVSIFHELFKNVDYLRGDSWENEKKSSILGRVIFRTLGPQAFRGWYYVWGSTFMRSFDCTRRRNPKTTLNRFKPPFWFLRFFQ